MPPVLRSTLHGAVGYAAVSIAAYSIWAFAPKLGGSEMGMYALIALVFLGGTGIALHGLLRGEHRMSRFYRLFLPAFFGYALLWSAAWFLIKGRPSEWIGALAGTLFFSFIAWRSLGRAAGFWTGALVLFALHALGYFVGGEWMYGILATGIKGWSKPRRYHRQTRLGLLPRSRIWRRDWFCLGLVAASDRLIGFDDLL